MARSEPPHILVLASGTGSRMGGPKATMEVGGRPWWQWQAERLERTGLPVNWVVSQQARDAMAAGPARSRPSTTLGDSGAPMFDSVMRGIETLRALPKHPKGVFILPVDVPAPDPAVWTALGKRRSVAVPVFDSKRGHPVYLPWSWVERNLSSTPRKVPGRRLDALIGDDLTEVEVDDPDVTTNLNRPEDVEAWLARSRSAARGGRAP